jgi:hypothetical protein
MTNLDLLQLSLKVLNHLSLLEKLDSRVLLCRVLVNRLFDHFSSLSVF